MADQPTHSTGAMLALYPDADTAAALAVDGGLPVDELHVTVAYLGKARDVNRGAMFAAAAQVIRDRPPVEARISGHARFTGGDDGDVAVALVDSPELEQLRRDLVDALGFEGIDLPGDHGYTAHMTQAYIAQDAPAPVDRIDPLPVTFTALAVVHGDDRTDLPFVGLRPRTVAELAREAYAQGWAVSGGPMTDQVRAGCVAAVEFAETHADDPGVLEATLHLGHLEGVWAHIFERRDQLHADNIAAVLAVWRPMAERLDMAGLVRRVRREAGVREALLEAVGNIADLTLNLIQSMEHDQDWGNLRAAVAEAIRAGQAEGHADALALSADQLNIVGLDMSIAFEDAYKALAGAPSLIGEADTWLQKMVGDNASALGTKLATLTADGAPYEDMLAAADDLVAGDARATSIVVDMLTARSLTDGALNLYKAEGVQQVDFLTAGDARVCVFCSDLEARNPYTVGGAPRAPMHPFCRCAVAARTPLRKDLLNNALAGEQAAAKAVKAGSLAERVASGERDARLLGSGDNGTVDLVTLNDGSTAVRKVARDGERAVKEAVDAEYLAGLFGRAAGIDVPEVVKAAADTVYMDYVGGAKTGLELFGEGLSAEDEAKAAQVFESEAGRRLGLFDLVTANNDRNDGNWLLKEADEKLWGIDHGMAFQDWGGAAKALQQATWGSPFAGDLLDFDMVGNVTGGSRAYSKADIEHLRDALKGLEDEFRSMRRTGWYRQAVSRLNLLEKYAGVEESLFGDTVAAGEEAAGVARAVGADLIEAGAKDLAKYVAEHAGEFESADPGLSVIAARQGFDGVPRVVSRDEIDRLLGEGDHVAIFRGVEADYGLTARELQEGFRSGKAWFGTGIRGNGYYFTTSEESAELYSDGTEGSVLRVLLPKGARIVNYDDINTSLAGDDSGSALFEDPGRWAAARGYDAIRVERALGDHYVLLNRTAVIVEEG